MVDRKTREELNALSLEVFGASGRWQKLVNKGYSQVVTEEVTELVPGETEDAEPTERKVQVPVKTASGAFQSVQKYHSIDSVRELMLRLKAQRDEYLAAIKKAQEEQKAKEEQEKVAKAVAQDLTGSAAV